MGCGPSRGLELSEKERKRCAALPTDALNLALFGLHRDRIVGAEVVVRLALASPNDAEPMRLLSNGVASNGSVFFELDSRGGSGGCCGGGSVADAHDVSLSIFDLREICVDPEACTVELKAVRDGAGDDAMLDCKYQTPDTTRFLKHVATAALRAYVGTPPATVPLAWSLNGATVPAVEADIYHAAFGSDGGFTTGEFSEHAITLRRRHGHSHTLRRRLLT
eukprot:scaffold1651_cov317-Pinguiococcus_pyrenoidosus.AAC.6